jgi:hypothetical protein
MLAVGRMWSANNILSSAPGYCCGFFNSNKIPVSAAPVCKESSGINLYLDKPFNSKLKFLINTCIRDIMPCTVQ